MTTEGTQLDEPMSGLRNDAERKAWPGFVAIRDYLGLGRSGYACEAFNRAEKAVWALQAWRDAAGQRRDPHEALELTVRVVADVLAGQIEAAAPADLDSATVRWVVAGLRCTSQPFCTGCTMCATVTSPQRPMVVPGREWLS
jgi:hypothetical protein